VSSPPVRLRNLLANEPKTRVLAPEQRRPAHEAITACLKLVDERVQRRAVAQGRADDAKRKPKRPYSGNARVTFDSLPNWNRRESAAQPLHAPVPVE
jgi:hypothetical protein